MLIRYRKQVVFIFIGVLVGIGLVIGNEFKIQAISDYSNKIFEGLLSLDLIMAMAVVLSVIGCILFVIGVAGKRAEWLYKIAQPVLKVFDEFCWVFINSMIGASFIVIIYYLPFESLQEIKSMTLFVMSMAVIFVFNRFIHCFVIGAATVQDELLEMKSPLYWFGGLAVLSLVYDAIVKL